MCLKRKWFMMWNSYGVKKKDKELRDACNRYSVSSIDNTRMMSEMIQKEYKDATGKREVPFWFILQWKLNNIKARIII